VNKKNNNKYFLFFRLAVTILIFFVLFKLVPYQKLVQIYKDAHKGYLLMGFLFYFPCYLIGAARWRFLLAHLNIHISFREAFLALFCGLFFNLFFPSFIAGDVFRGFSISGRCESKNDIISSILMDRFSGAIALTLLALLSFVFASSTLHSKQVAFLIFLLCFLMFVSFLLIFSKRFFLTTMKIFRKNPLIEQKILNFHDRLYFFKKNPRIFLKSFLFSFPIQISIIISFYMVAKAFSVNIDITYFFVLVPIIGAIALIPITPAGAGTREMSAVYFFSLVGISKSVGLGISLTNLFFLVLLGICGGIFYVTVYHRWLQPSS